MSSVWIFAYGSLLWDPGFTPAEIRPARLAGWKRDFCLESVHYRGTSTAPGLVLALDAEETAQCAGLALRLPETSIGQDLAVLRARELVSNAYLETAVQLETPDGPLAALTYVINPQSPQYCRLPLAEQARRIAHAQGTRGPNHDYLFNTLARLESLQIDDAQMAQLAAAVRQRLERVR